jgi:hypothetical protein
VYGRYSDGFFSLRCTMYGNSFIRSAFLRLGLDLYHTALALAAECFLSARWVSSLSRVGLMSSVRKVPE